MIPIPAFLIAFALLAAPSNLTAQIRPEFIPEVAGSTVAALPATCKQGLQRRLTDGDAAGSIVQCNASNEWYDPEFFQSKTMRLGMPPWNIVTDGVTDQASKFNTAATDFFALESDPYPYKIVMPNGPMLYSSALMLVDNDTALLAWLQCGVRSQFLMEQGSGIGLQIGSSPAETNKVTIDKCDFRSVTTPPAQLLTIQSAQAKLIDIGLGGYTTTGLTFVNGPHAEIVRPLCAAASGAGTCMSFTTPGSVTITDGKVEDTVDNLDSRVININTAASATGTRDVVIDGFTGIQFGRFLTVGGTGRIRRLTLNNINVQQLDNACIQILNTDALNISDVACAGENLGNGLTLNDVTRVTTKGLDLDDFVNGVSATNVRGGTIEANINSASTSCVVTGGNTQDTDFKVNVTGGCGTNVFNIAGASLGGNTFMACLNDATSKAAGITSVTTGMHATDRVILCPRTQTVTCADETTGAAAVPTMLPYADTISLDNDDTSGGCIYQPTTTGAVVGMEIDVKFESTVSAQPVKVSVDGGTNCHTLTTGSYPAKARYTGSAWTFAPGVTTAAC